jgi:hypothetical protein
VLPALFVCPLELVCYPDLPIRAASRRHSEMPYTTTSFQLLPDAIAATHVLRPAPPFNSIHYRTIFPPFLGSYYRSAQSEAHSMIP